ncbi:PEP-CTERM sorting domain-containing protein [Bythopirellula polymerisocia]|uniref:Ice-binding protein C-terminal domain-containing protein n=1 Tax=Bythopirellula polymerisocia TaxID=2528003 RepID=A0A5C6CTI9_9BACT|nr:PEP-CTERM sorting domain-containing protein [Bythopirellula polymerisocia]TWU28253.1 hypothetical protein Pla144_15400 [Bythopirellula polymerisocia]
MNRCLLLTPVLALSFVLTACGEVFFTEAFDYSDGDLTTQSGGLWANHSGGSPSIQVANEAAVVKIPGSEDVNRLTSTVLTPGDTWLYALKFSVSDTRINPSGQPLATNFFAHFKDAGPANFRGRLYITAGTAPTNFQMGITSSSGSLNTIWGSAMEFDTTYTAVVSYTASLNDPRTEIPVNPVNPFDDSGVMPNPIPQPLSGMDGWASLWINPTNFESPRIIDMAPDSNVGNDLRSGMNSLALRQAGGSTANADILIDIAATGDDFEEVMSAVGGIASTPGDFDIDGDIDGHDFLEWQRGNSTPVGQLSASDLMDWQNAYGTPLVAAVSAVPEPATLALLGLTLVPLACGRKRKWMV